MTHDTTEIARAIVAELAALEPGWTFATNEHGQPSAVAPDGAHVWIRSRGRRVSTWYTQPTAPHAPIGVQVSGGTYAADRPARAMARGILRARPAYDAAVGRRAAEDLAKETDAARAVMLDEAIALAGGPVLVKRRPGLFSVWPDGWYGRVEIDGDRVRLSDLLLPAEVALELLRRLREIHAGRR